MDSEEHPLAKARSERGWGLRDLADRAYVSIRTIIRAEDGERLNPESIQRICNCLGKSAPELGLQARGTPRSTVITPAGASELAALELTSDDNPAPDDIEAATLRLRRSYSTTPPQELQQRAEYRLRQVKRLLAEANPTPSQRLTLMEAGAWLTLIRATVLADMRQFEAAETSVHVARDLARQIGHSDIEAWTWETAAWIAATDGRQLDARDLATNGVELAPLGGYGLIAATMQRARINGAIGNKSEAIRDLIAGQRAHESAGEPEWPDDHYSLDGPKIAFYSSGTFAQLGLPAETVEHAAQVISANEDPSTRNYWPMRAANARVEWAMALARQGNEDAAVAMAALALAPQWLRPDTDRRTRKLLREMRDPQLRSDLADQLAAAWEQVSKLHA